MNTRLTRTALELVRSAGLRVLAIEDRTVLASSSGAKLVKRAGPPATVLSFLSTATRKGTGRVRA
jgi:hypothetical protein